MYRIISILLLFLILLTQLPSLPIATSNNLLKHNSYELVQRQNSIVDLQKYWQTYVIDVKNIPPLIGARADSLLIALYDGIKWYYGEIWVWNGSRTIWTPYNMTIDIPNAGKYLTDNCRLIIRIPLYIKNEYTEEWSVHAILSRLHNKVYIELNDQGITRGFYIFYDKHYSRGMYPFISPSKYIQLFNKASHVISKNILRIKPWFVHTFLVSRDLKRVIAYNMTYAEFTEKYGVEFIDPPWQIDGGGGGGPLPNEEYWFFIPVINQSVTVINGGKKYSIYIGSSVYKAILCVKVYNPSSTASSELTIGIDEIEVIDNKHQKLLEGHNYVYYIDPQDELYIEIPVYLAYNQSRYYALNITFLSPLIKICEAYLTVIKDYSGVYDTYPTPETKDAIYGYMEEAFYSTNMWIKYNEALSEDEFSILSTPVINGFYLYGDSSKYGIYVKMKYYIERNTSVEFCLNGVPIYSIDLITGDVLHTWQVKEIWIPLSKFSDIVKDAIKSGLGLVLSIKTDILQNVVEHIGFREIYIKLPFHPDIWRPRSYAFGKHVHIAGLAGIQVYPDGIYSTGQVSFIIAVNEYSYDPDGDDITSYDIIAEVLASGIEYPEANYNSMVHEVIVNLSVPKYVYGSALPTRPAESIYLEGQANSELNSTKEIAKHAYWIADAMYNVYGLLSSGENPILGGILFVLGKIIDILQESVASVGVDIIDSDLYRTYLIIWNGGLQPVKYGRFRYIIPIVRSEGIKSDGVIKGGVYVLIDAEAYCYIEAKVLSGQTLYRSEKYVVEGNRLLVNR